MFGSVTVARVSLFVGGVLAAVLGSAHLVAVTSAASTGTLSGAVGIVELWVIGLSLVVPGTTMAVACFGVSESRRWGLWLGGLGVVALAAALIRVALLHGVTAPGPVLPVVVAVTGILLVRLARGGRRHGPGVDGRSTRSAVPEPH
ncbi:MAG TPA: hypothetical protein VGR21_10945 [Cryptosporangiaceae bacterium]|nr:hypothetical protein [Cryptosporangiaceae bacterium]